MLSSSPLDFWTRGQGQSRPSASADPGQVPTTTASPFLVDNGLQQAELISSPELPRKPVPLTEAQSAQLEHGHVLCLLSQLQRLEPDPTLAQLHYCLCDTLSSVGGTPDLPRIKCHPFPFRGRHVRLCFGVKR